MAKHIGYHNCDLTDFMNLAKSISDSDGLAFITLDYNDQLTLYQPEKNGRTNSKIHKHQLDCQCHQNISTPDRNSFFTGLQSTLDQKHRAIYRLLLQTSYYCSCIKTKILLAMAMIEQFGAKNAISRFNRVLNQSNLHSPLTKQQIIDLIT